MANHVNRNNFDDNAEDIHNDVSQLADTLEEVLTAYNSGKPGKSTYASNVLAYMEAYYGD